MTATRPTAPRDASPATPGLVTVVGIAGAELGAGARAALAQARTVAGGRRQLASHAPPHAERIQLGADLPAALARIAAAPGPVVVLASGDPGYYGIVRRLREAVGAERLRVLPAPSSVALAFARAGLPWEDALVVSGHGREPARALNAARAHPKVAVLTSPDFTPAVVAAALAGLDRTLVVCSRLGEPDELVVEGSPARIATMTVPDPNVVLVLDRARLGSERPACVARQSPAGWALPDTAFAHRGGMITKAEIRALALARLGPGVGDLVWDVGAGSGSIAVECARHGAAAIAIERNPEDCERIRDNAVAHGVAVQVVEGIAPAALAGLPEPDAVFVGGGGTKLSQIVQAASCARRCVVVSLVALERVAAAAHRLEHAGFEVETVMLQASRVRGIAGVSRLAAENPVFLVTGQRR